VDKLQNKIISYLKRNNIKAWEIKRGVKKNPFPVGTNYFYEIYRGKPTPIGARLKMLHFFEQQRQNKKSAKAYPKH